MSDRHSKSLFGLLFIADSAFPTGAHGHSAGLEFAIQQGWVDSPQTLAQWGAAVLEKSLMTLDARAIAKVWTLDLSVQPGVALLDLNSELAASRGSLIQREASAQVGRSFLRSFGAAYDQRTSIPEASRPWLDLARSLPSQTAPNPDLVQFPIAWALAGATLDLSLDQTITAFMSGAVRQLIQVALRIMGLGQNDALAVQAALLDFLQELDKDWSAEAREPLESTVFGFDMAGLGQEQLTKRYFKS